MSNIKRNGAPTKSTKGSVGDTYIDLNSSKQYKCVSVFRDSLGGVEYEWKYTSIADRTDIQEKKATPEEARRLEETVKTELKDTIQSEQKRERPNNNYRKQYNKQYNKQNKN